MLWQLASFPTCRYHVFLSHCQEDRDCLVGPVHERLAGAKIKSFLDIEDYYYGRDSRTALRDGILNSRHSVFFVTDAMLNSARGWCVIELAFAELLETNLHYRGGKLANFILPLFSISQADPRLPRSVWQLVRDRGRFFDPVSDGDLVEWCQREIRDFLVRERQVCKNVAQLALNDQSLTAELRKTTCLFDRVTKFQPRLPKLPSTPSSTDPLL